MYILILYDVQNSKLPDIYATIAMGSEPLQCKIHETVLRSYSYTPGITFDCDQTLDTASDILRVVSTGYPKFLQRHSTRAFRRGDIQKKLKPRQRNQYLN